MPNPIKAGNLNPQRQRRVYSYDPDRGDSYSETWENADEASMFAHASFLRYNRISYEIVVEDNHATLTTQDPTGEYTLDTWQIENDELSPSPLVNPRNVAACGVPALELIAKLSAGMESYDDLKTQLDGEAAALRLLERMHLGQTSYFKARPVVRHTTNVSARYNYNVASDYVEHIYSPSEFLSEVQSSSLWLFTMPNMLWNTLLSYPIPAVRTGYEWGYLKRPPTISTSASNRIDVTTIYLLDQWSTDEYASR